MTNTTQKSKKAATNTTTPTKAPTKPKAKRSYNKNTKVANEAKVATNVAKSASEQYAEPTVEELKVGQDNLSKLLVISNQKLLSSIEAVDFWKEKYFNLSKQSWWSITKERFSYTLKSWVMLF